MPIMCVVRKLRKMRVTVCRTQASQGGRHIFFSVYPSTHTCSTECQVRLTSVGRHLATGDVMGLESYYFY